MDDAVNIYRLKTGVECARLMRAVDRCRGKVLLKTARGDTLNLKSELSQFVFLSAFGNTNLTFEAVLALSEPSDYKYVAECVVVGRAEKIV